MEEKLKRLYQIQALIVAASELEQRHGICGGHKSYLDNLLNDAHCKINAEIIQLENSLL